MDSQTFKLPRLPKTYFPRERLLSLVDDVLARKYIVVGGGRELGATALVAHWCRSKLEDGTVVPVWHTASARDALECFEADLDDADRRARGARAEHGSKVDYQRRCRMHFDGLCEHAAQANRDLVIVIDDYDRALATKLGETVSQLVEAAPLYAHFILLARDAGTIPTAVHRALSECAVIEPAELAFTEDEVANFIRLNVGCDTTDAEAAALRKLTSGLLPALKLASDEVAGSSSIAEGLEALMAGRAAPVGAYLEEVLLTMGPGATGFLTRASLLERLDAEACREVLRCELDEKALGESLRFGIVSKDGAGWAYTPAFARALQMRAGLEGSDDAREVTRRTVAWRREHGDFPGALRAAILFGDADILGEVMANPSGGDVRAVVEAVFKGEELGLNPLPEEVAEQHPLLLMLLACAFLNRDNAVEADALLRRAAVLEGSAETPVGQWISVLEVLAKGQQGDVGRGVELVEQVESATADADAYLRSWLTKCKGAVYSRSLHTSKAIDAFRESVELGESVGDATSTLLASYQLAKLYVHAGKLLRAEDALQRARAAAARLPRTSPSTGLVDVGMAHVSLARGSLDEAWELAEHGGDVLGRGGNVEFRIDAQLIVAALMGLAGDLELARRTLEAAVRTARENGCVHSARLATSRLMCVRYRTGDEEAPLVWARSAHGADDGDFAAYEAEQLAAARILLAAGEQDAAAYMLELLVPRLRSAHHSYELVEALLLHAACEKPDSADAAARELMEAVRIAAPELIVLPFTREAELLRGLCERTPFLEMASADIDWERIGSFLKQLGVETAPTASRPREAVPQAAELTGREREVLRLLHDGMSDQEIADALSISKHTVHAHCRNLYKKLGVSSRREAAGIASQATRR